MTSNATPRDLDPKFKDAVVPDNAHTNETESDRTGEAKAPEESAQDRLKRLQSTEIAKDPGEGFIVHRQPYTASDGTVGEKVHGPMPVGDWASYSAKNGL